MLSIDYHKVERLAGESGMSMSDLARAMKLNSPGSIYSIKRNSGRVRVKTIARIAKQLKCTIEDLLLPPPKNGKAKPARKAGKVKA